MIVWQMMVGRTICRDCGFIWPLTYHMRAGKTKKHCRECDGHRGEVYETFPEKVELASLKCRCCGMRYVGTFFLPSLSQLTCTECGAQKMEIVSTFEKIPLEKP